MGAKQKNGQPLTGFDSDEYCWTCLSIVRNQELSLNIILDTALRNILLSFGSAYLTRMTTYTPCLDTLSITRRGDTIPMDYYDWMVVHFNNDSSVIPTLLELAIARPVSLDLADVSSSAYKAAGITPCDPEYTAGNQTCLVNIGMPTAWAYSVGSSAVQVAVIDEGINYNFCEFGGGIGTGFHVGGGVDELPPPPPPANDAGGYTTAGIDAHGMPAPSAFVDANHGTAVASIISALTNNVGCGNATDWGMAGVAGGWGLDACPGGGKNGTGVTLLGYRCAYGGGFLDEYIEDAILDAVGKTTHVGSLAHPGVGYGARVLNASIEGGSPSSPSDNPSVRRSMAEAARQGAVFVASKGNYSTGANNYPSDYNPMKDVIAVGASNVANNSIEHYSDYNDYTDLVAPGGDDLGGPLIRALQSDASGNETLGWWYGTSFAAPHVSGVLGLMMSYYPSIPNSLKPFTEDWEGMLEASANAGSSSQDFQPAAPGTPPTISGSGWGFLHADKMFTMLDPTIGTYRIFHYTITGSNLETPADWTTISWQTGANATLWDIGYTGSLPFAKNGTYSYKRREIKGSIHYSSTIDRTKEVYVWGTGGGSNSATEYGWPPGNPVIEEPWAEVIDAQGGDGTYPNIKRPGIRHSFSALVKAHTYQYRITTDGGTSWNDYPTDANLGINITVFGSSVAPASVAPQSIEMGGLSVWPSIASATISVHSPSSDRGTFEVFDAVGRLVMERNLNAGHSDFQIETQNLPEGFYTCRLVSASVSQTTRFLVRH